MPDQGNSPIVINDRRRFRDTEDTREAQPSTTTAEPVAAAADQQETVAPATGPVPVEATHTNSAHLITPVPEPVNAASVATDEDEDYAADELARDTAAGAMPPPPTPEEMEQVRAAYEATTERLDTVMRSQNLGGERVPPMDFARLVQSIYMSAMIQLGAGTQQGQQARVDLIGAKQSIDVLSVIDGKSRSNLSGDEQKLLHSALFELRMGFLEITQLLARQAAAKQPPAAPGQTGAGTFGGGSFTGAGPRIVR